jgi:hypothetical protein
LDKYQINKKENSGGYKDVNNKNNWFNYIYSFIWTKSYKAIFWFIIIKIIISYLKVSENKLL